MRAKENEGGRRVSFFFFFSGREIRRRRVKGGGVCISTSFVHYLQQVVAFEVERKEVFSRQSKLFFLFFAPSSVFVCYFTREGGNQSGGEKEGHKKTKRNISYLVIFVSKLDRLGRLSVSL